MTEPEIGAFDFSGLRATFVNCTLKRSPEPSNTQALVDISAAIMRKHGVEVEVIRAVDHDIATGVYLDMTEHGWDRDEWPTLFARIIDVRHPGRRRPDLAGRQLQHHQAGDRTALRRRRR